MNDPEKLARTAYDMGFIDGLRAYAHWKDGVEYVGTCGTTFHDAVEKRRELVEYKAGKSPEQEIIAGCVRVAAANHS